MSSFAKLDCATIVIDADRIIQRNIDINYNDCIDLNIPLPISIRHDRSNRFADRFYYHRTEKLNSIYKCSIRQRLHQPNKSYKIGDIFIDDMNQMEFESMPRFQVGHFYFISETSAIQSV
jgi:hypothetical protein